MLETGFVIFAGIALVAVKLKRSILLRLLGHSLAIDLTVTVLTLVIHWGSFSGVMAASVAGVMTSIATSAAKRAFGYVRGGQYTPGFINLAA